jgi:hypothetical protein
MNKNHIEGRRDGTSWHNTAKSTGSVVEVNVAVVQGSNALLPGEILAGQPVGKSAETVVATDKPGASGPCKLDTGSLDAVKGQTNEEGSDHVEDIRAETASRRGLDECRGSGSRRAGRPGDSLPWAARKGGMRGSADRQAWGPSRTNHDGADSRPGEPCRGLETGQG